MHIFFIFLLFYIQLLFHAAFTEIFEYFTLVYMCI